MVKRTTKEFIIDTANELFKVNGYEKVTIIDICNACNISKTTFYYHLKSKEEILLHFYDQITHNISIHLVSMLSQSNYWDQYISCFESLVEASCKYGPDFCSQMLITNLKQDQGSFDMRSELTEIMVMIISKAQEEGQVLSQSEPKDMYTACAYAYLGHEVTWCIKKGNHQWKKLLRKTLEVICCVHEDFRLAE